ncbi:VCBS domain-containing protein [Vibrio vulnificus]|uniref:VCBS domain-containing protein n=1 Tax=Vibrio vulnificus TaxID=672 RepID=UPI001F24CEBE|nr:VCBS domain-containing protein [Vibrio vulnificus]
MDNTDNSFTAKTIEGTNGTFSIDANGAWTFVANSAFNEMNVGDSKVEKLHGDVGKTGTPQVVKVTIKWHERCGDDRRRHSGRGG